MKILVSAYTGLGNFILRIPVINKIKELFPDAKVDAITGTDSLDNVFSIAQSIEAIDEVYQLSQSASISEKFHFFKSLREKKYEAIFLPFDSKPRFLTVGSYVSQIPLRVMHQQLPSSNYKKAIFQAIKLCLYPGTLYVPLLQGRHEIDLNYDLLESYINKPFERGYATPLPYQDSPSLLRDFQLSKGEYIVIQLSARHGYPTPKTWNPENFRLLIQDLHKRYPNNPIVTVGSEKEYKNCIGEFIKEFPYLINTAGKTSFNDVIAILANAKLVVAHDSGLMHVTNAVNTPLIALYGPTDYTRTRPLGEHSHILYSRNQHFAKMYNFKTTEESLAKDTAHYACMSGIAVEDVLDKIDTLLADRK